MPTIGVSVAVPDPCGAQLQEYRVALGDESARHIPTHITLLPPYDVSEAELEALAGHLQQTATAIDPFRVHLRGTGTFRPVSPVVFIGVVEGISQCEQLALDVRTGPFDLGATFPYHPHVTVAHHLDDDLLDRAFEEMADFEYQFGVEQFWLYCHDDRNGWRPTQAFTLGR